MFDCRTKLAAARTATFLAMVAMVCCADRAAADVVTVGVVAPIPPVNGGTSSAQLIVGNGTNDEGNELWGWVDIDGGTLLQYGSVILGDNEGFNGQVNISGNLLAGQITQFNLSGTGTSTNPVVQVGNEGTGYLNIDGGARMTLTNANADFAIGLETTGIGTVTASDQFTMITAQETMVVGQEGIGTLNVLNGALVRTISNSRTNYLAVGLESGSIGSVFVDGRGSTLRASSTLQVGVAGTGSLTVSNGALALAIDGNILNSPNTPFVGIGTNVGGVGHVTVEGTGSMLQALQSVVVGGTDSLTGAGTGLGTLTIRDGGYVQITTKNASTANVGPFGRLELHGGTFDGSLPVAAPMPAVPAEYGTIVNGYIGGSGLVRGSVYIGGFASAGANSGDTLRFDGPVLNQGSININGGEMQFFASFRNNAALPGPLPPAAPAGRISLENGGTLRLPSGLTTINNGVISNSHGTTNIYGRINNNGEIVVARDTVATFFDTVNNTGTITVLPGGNALFLADLTFTSMGSLLLGLGSEELNDGNSQVNSDGVMTLDGTLAITLNGSFDEFVGQSLQLLSSGGGIVGEFDEVLFPLVPNDIDVSLTYSATGLMMTVNSISPGDLPGDYNEDGIVNAADYSVWRDNLGSATALPNDDTPGVGDDDYARWKAHFGEEVIVGSGAASPTATPEPTTAILLAIAFSICGALRRR